MMLLKVLAWTVLLGTAVSLLGFAAVLLFAVIAFCIAIIVE